MTSLTNEDFKALLKRPKEEVFGSSSRSTAASKDPDPTKSKPKAKEQDAKRKEKKKQKSEEWKTKLAAKQEQQAKYRDRAEERRTNHNPDYAGIEDPSRKTENQINPFDEVKDANKLSIENSKYLGGDLKYTHLVKGLDLALLAKVKSEITEEERMRLEQKKAEEEKQQHAPATIHTTCPLAQRIAAITLHKQMTQGARELFLPGRMAFVFEMDSFDYYAAPTTLLRSKDDCPEPQEQITGRCDQHVSEKIEKLYAYIRQGGSHKKRKRREGKDGTRDGEDGPADHQSRVSDAQDTNDQEMAATQQQHTAHGHSHGHHGHAQTSARMPPSFKSGGDNSDDDIYDDVGTYNTRKHQAAPDEAELAHRADSRTYFKSSTAPTTTSTSGAEPVAVPDSLEMINKTLVLVNAQHQFNMAQQKYQQYQEDRLAAKVEGPTAIFHNPVDPAKQPRKIPRLADSDGYDECYPDEYAMDVAVALDASDDDDEETLDSRQFGIKQTEGRMSKKRMQQKLKHDMNKINQVLDKRKRDTDGGMDDGGGFD